MRDRRQTGAGDWARFSCDGQEEGGRLISAVWGYKTLPLDITNPKKGGTYFNRKDM